MSGDIRSRTVRIRFDPTARRWWIEDGSAEPGAEVVIDAVVPSRSDLDDVRAAFGAEVAASVEHLAHTRVDEVIDHTLDISAPPALLAVEPGVLVGAGSDTWVTDTGNGTARITVGPAAIHVIVTGAVGAALWARVSTSRTGMLLAVGPLLPTAENGALESTLAFGLDLDPSEMVVTVTEQPTAPIGDRWQRAEQRFDTLMRDAIRRARLHPLRAATLAERAMALADVLGDPTRSAMATDLARTWRRRSLIRWVSVGALIAATAAALVTGLGGRPQADGAIDAPSDAGPATFVFADGSAVSIGSESTLQDLRPGGTWWASLRFTTREVGLFDTDGDLDRAEQRCRLGTPVAVVANGLAPETAAVVITRSDGTGREQESVLLGMVPANPQTDGLAAVPESCGDLTVIDGSVLAEHSVIRAGQTAGFDLDDSLEPGTWSVSVSMGTQEVESVFAAVRFVVTAND